MSFAIFRCVATASAASWFTNGIGDATLRAEHAPITPRDPSTFSLALVGLGTIAIYSLLNRRRRKPLQATPARSSLSAESTRDAA